MVWVAGFAVFLLFLVLFPRMTLVILGLGIIAGVGTAIWYGYKQHLDNEARNAVRIGVRFDPDRCSEDFPLLVEIGNSSDRIVEEADFYAQGRRPRHSNPLYKHPYERYSTDRIITPGETWRSCWRIPPKSTDTNAAVFEAHPPESLIWEATNVYVKFRKDG